MFSLLLVMMIDCYFVGIFVLFVIECRISMVVLWSPFRVSRRLLGGLRKLFIVVVVFNWCSLWNFGFECCWEICGCDYRVKCVRFLCNGKTGSFRIPNIV